MAENGPAKTSEVENGERAEYRVRLATLRDAGEVATILAEAFPDLYRSTFGTYSASQTSRLLTALYTAGCLSLEATLIALREESVIGVAILHLGEPIGRGTARNYWRVLCQEMGVFTAVPPFLGGLAMNQLLTRRIPHAPDLVYIEALAVRASERGQGVGKQLLEAAQDWAEHRGFRRLALHVLERNHNARRLYERFGFALWDKPARHHRLPLPPGASGWRALLMLKTLSDYQAAGQ